VPAGSGGAGGGWWQAKQLGLLVVTSAAVAGDAVAWYGDTEPGIACWGRALAVGVMELLWSLLGRGNPLPVSEVQTSFFFQDPTSMSVSFCGGYLSFLVMSAQPK